ncbi:EndoU domain-containing protein [Neisseria sp. Ec49-e6-T10]|uniref:EndoU domain-containing protein n=1 Tax=Neisseria sp. Ec49-e6-T10 TaxID=3140744 RepID=UPI003EBC18E8
MANIGNNKYAFVNVEETLAKHGLSVDKELLQAKAPEKAPEKLNKEQELISEHFNRSYPPKGRLKEIVQQMNNHQVDKQLSEFTPKEQYILKEAVGFVTHDYAGDPPKINQLQINQEEIQLNLGKQNEQFNLSTPKIIAGEPLEDSIKKPVETQLEPENTEHKIIAQKGDTGWSLAQKLDSEHPYEALGVLYRSGQIKDIKLKDGNQHIIPNIQPNKEYTYDRSQYTEEQQAKNEQAGRQIVTGQSLANEHIDLARAQALEEQRERNPNLQQQTQITQLFQNINNQVANNPNMANGLSKQELESVIKEQLSRYQEHSLINKGVSVAAMHKFSQSETLQAAVNRSDKSINTVEALQWVNNTAQNVPLSNIRPLTAQPSVMPIMKMTNYEGKPLTEVEQAAYSKGANESMLSGLKEMVNDANLLSKDILNTVGYSLLGGLYDQTAARESIHRNNERMNSLFNSVGFLAGSATGQTMYYSAHPDEFIKGVNGMLTDRQEQVQQLKVAGKYDESGRMDGKIGFEVLAAVAPLGMTKNAKNLSKAADALHDTNNTINLERKLGAVEKASGVIAKVEIPEQSLKHADIGDFTVNPSTGEISKMKGGGHGQSNIDFLKENGLEVNIEKTYPNGVRIGNVPDHKIKAKRTGNNQSWFPENWTNKDIENAGQHIANQSNFADIKDGEAVFGEYRGVRIGIIKTDGKLATIFPDTTKQP